MSAKRYDTIISGGYVVDGTGVRIVHSTFPNSDLVSETIQQDLDWLSGLIAQ